jgi:hypothetical protein
MPESRSASIAASECADEDRACGVDDFRDGGLVRISELRLAGQLLPACPLTCLAVAAQRRRRTAAVQHSRSVTSCHQSSRSRRSHGALARVAPTPPTFARFASFGWQATSACSLWLQRRRIGKPSESILITAKGRLSPLANFQLPRRRLGNWRFGVGSLARQQLKSRRPPNFRDQSLPACECLAFRHERVSRRGTGPRLG